MPLFRALAKNMAASYFGKKAPYGFVMGVTLLYVFILWFGRAKAPFSHVTEVKLGFLTEAKFHHFWGCCLPSTFKSCNCKFTICKKQLQY